MNYGHLSEEERYRIGALRAERLGLENRVVFIDGVKAVRSFTGDAQFDLSTLGLPPSSRSITQWLWILIEHRMNTPSIRTQTIEDHVVLRNEVKLSQHEVDLWTLFQVARFETFKNGANDGEGRILP